MVYTEMLSAEGLARNHGKTWRMAAIDDSERPIALQLFGNRPQAFAEAISRFSGAKPDFFDLNFGCPAPKVVRSGSGSALLRDPEKVEAIARAAVEASDRPVLAKIRSGWEVGAENAVEIAKRLEGCGVAAVAVHGRTRSQMFSGQADWRVIADVRRAISIPVIGNGDVRAGQDAKRMMDQTGCDLVMVGRAAQGAPWIFEEIDRVLEGASDNFSTEGPTWSYRMEVILEHLRLMVEAKGQERGVLEMRKHLGWYLKGLPGAARGRRELMQARTADQVEEILRSTLRMLPRIPEGVAGC